MYTKQQLDTMDGISKAFGLSNDIIKGGEGSKGGKVIGHTKSGKPIYDTHDHPNHKTFTKQDHHEAALAHSKMNVADDISDEEYDHHWEESGKHIISSQRKNAKKD